MSAIINIPLAEVCPHKGRSSKDSLFPGEESRECLFPPVKLFGLSEEAVWRFNIMTGELWWSMVFYRLAGFDPGLQAPGFYEWAKRIHPDDRNKVMARINGISSIGLSYWEDECRVRAANGTYKTVLDIALVCYDGAGRACRAVGALVDVRDRSQPTPDLCRATLQALRENAESECVVH